MLVVGLTGGIATGKSRVAKMFQKSGALLIDADEIARKLVEPNQPTLQKIVDRFGPGMVRADGKLKRKVLANKIFDSDRERWALNAIMHPPIVAEIEIQLKELAKANPHSIVIAEIPLLFELEWPFEWDKIIVVVTKQALQFERLCLREPKLNQFKFKKRLRTQLPLEEKAKRADWAVNNNGSLKETKDQVAAIYQQLKLLAGQA